MTNKILDYLKKSNNNMRQSPIGDLLIGGIRVYVKEPIPSNIDIYYCFSYILEKMPKFFYSNLDKIVVGQFPFLRKREVDAIYKDKTIYVTNNQETNESLMADIVHELAHAFEEHMRDDLYGDEQIKNEFLSKRKALFNILNTYNLVQEPINEQDFYNIEYSEKFDTYLYKVIGYNKLGPLTRDIFISPYASTCLREYFANAFEIFFINDMFLVKKHTPSIYKKLTEYLEF